MVVDLHEDVGYHFLMGGAAHVRPFSEDTQGRHADIPKYRKSGMRLVLGSIFPLVGSINLRKMDAMERMYGNWSPSSALASPRDVAIELVKVYYGLEDLYPDDLKIVRTKDDIEGLGKRVGIVLHIEGGEALGEPEDLRIFYNLGVRSIGLTWNYDTKFAASCLSSKDYGLTGEGEDLLRAAAKLGVMVDLSHASPRASAETVDQSDLPPFFSHSNCLALEKTRRNISDDLIRETGRRGGIVGLTFIRSCIGRPYGPARLAEHARHMLKVGGRSLPALGTDYLGMSGAPEGLEDLSKLGTLAAALKSSGLSAAEAKGVMNDNAYRFILQRSELWHP